MLGCVGVKRSRETMKMTQMVKWKTSISTDEQFSARDIIVGKFNCDNLYSFMFHEKLQDVKANRSRLSVAEIEALIGRHTEADEDCILICQGKRFASKPKL